MDDRSRTDAAIAVARIVAALAAAAVIVFAYVTGPA